MSQILSRTATSSKLGLRSITSAKHQVSRISQLAKARQLNRIRKRTMSTGPIAPESIKTASGVSLSSAQKPLNSSVLDLFAGHASNETLSTWADDGTFEDPLAIAKGRKEYSAQWYGLKAAFSEIERLNHEVTDAGNPIMMDMKMRYVVKGINKAQTIQSVVAIHTTEDGAKITKVQDKWNGELPEGSVQDAFRRLNAVTLPHLVSTPGEKNR